MQEFAKKENFNISIPDVSAGFNKDEQKNKYTIDEGKEFRIYEMTCRDCKQEFTRSIPNKWFNGDNEIKQHFLPENLNVADIQAVLENPQCGTCQPETKKKLDDLKAQNK